MPRCTNKTLLLVAGQTTRQLPPLLAPAGYQLAGQAKTVEQALVLLEKNRYDAVLVDGPLADGPGDAPAVFAAQKGMAALLLLKAPEYAGISAEVERWGVFTLEKPVSEKVFAQVLRLMAVFENRLQNLETEKEQEMRQKLQEVQVISRAKCILVEYLRMNEEQAHKYIERQAMDMRQPKWKIAQGILKTYED